MPVSRNTVIVAVLFALLVGVGFSMNPSPELHRARIKAMVAERSPVAGALGLGTVAGLVSTYHSLGIASYTTAGDRTLSYGAFGYVYVPVQTLKS